MSSRMKRRFSAPGSRQAFRPGVRGAELQSRARTSRALVTVWLVVAMGLGAGCWGRKVDGKKSYTRLQLAKDFLGKHQLDAAEQEGNRSLGHDPRNEEALLVLGLVDYLRAVDTFRLLELDDCLTGIDAESLRDEFDRHLLAADKHFSRAFQLAPDYGEALANRGIVATQMGDHEAAIAHLTEALGLPNRLDNIGLTRCNLGWAYFQQGDMVKAANHLRQCEQFQPDMCVASYRMGRVYFARKEWEKAGEKFRKVTEQSCPIQEAHLFLMKSIVAMGTPEGVSPQMVEQCVEMAPKSCVAAQCRSIVPR